MSPILGRMEFVVTRAHSQKRRAVVLHLVFGCAMACAGLASQRVWAGDAGLDVSQYAHTAWKVRDGFTKGPIIAIAQTPDGYLWLGTELGLYRFDGMRAVPWQAPNGDRLPSNDIRSLLVARDSTLWIGTNKGLASWKNGRLTRYPEVGGPILDLLQVRDGTVWFTVSGPGRVCVIRGGRAHCDGGRFGSHALALYQDHEGNLWVTTTTGLWWWEPGPPQQYTFPSGLVEVNSIIESDYGTLLLATNKGLKQLAGSRIRDYALAGVNRQFRPSKFLRSSDGSLWIGGVQGLLHLDHERMDIFAAADGLSGDFIDRIFEDREGNVWVSTITGLDRFRDYAVRRISKNQGLSSNDAYSIQATQDGAIWIGTSDKLNRWKKGHVTLYNSGSAVDQSGRRNGRDLNIGGAVTQVGNSGLEGIPRSLGLDDQGRLYVATGEGIFHFEGNRFIRVLGAAGGNIWSISGDDDGKLWVNDGTVGLFHFTPGEAAQPIRWPQFGQKGSGPQAMLADRSNGGLWLGFNETGISYFKDGQIRASYAGIDGLGSGRVNDLRIGSHGGVWAATEGGLSRIKDGHIETLSSKNGLPCDNVHWSIEDDDHDMWVYMPCGLARIEHSEWYAWVNDPKHLVKTAIFDSFDGVATVGNYGGYGPHVTKAPDGKIWFVTYDGVSVIDPRHLPYNKLPPPLHVEKITADGKSFDPTQGLQLPSRVQHLDIDYTALSLVTPEKNRFRFRLEGYDRDWRDAGNRRQAFYTNLPPRKYRFRVVASNNSGIWNEEGASLDFSIAPAYYQTNWFRALCVAGALALLGCIYQLRTQKMQRELKLAVEKAGLYEGLKTRDAKIRRLVDANIIGIYIIDLEGQIIEANDAFLRMLGYEREDLVSGRLRWTDLTPPEWRAADAKRLEKVKLTGSLQPFEKEYFRKDGTRVPVLVGVARFEETKNEAVVFALDTSEQKHAQANLQNALDEIKKLKDRLQDENVALREEVDHASMFEEIIGASAALKAVLSRVSKVAGTDSTVLLTGETGTGKELIARAIHKRSHRSSRPFVSVNCAAIPASLIASELFGHEKGAFTGAVERRLGRFEVAEQGTIFLDEVGELPAETQIALLRVLQEREFERVGSTRTLRANVRVIAATNRDLEDAIVTGAFRSDLFYRLNVFPIEIPPLRERKEDIPLLVEYFVSRFARKAGKDIHGINKKTLDLLLSYPWPGNIRELQNVVERSVIVCDTENFSVDKSWLSRQPHAAQPKSSLELSQLATQEKGMIEAALRESGGRVFGPSGAAAKLGIPGTTLESKIKSLKINKNHFKATTGT